MSTFHGCKPNNVYIQNRQQTSFNYIKKRKRHFKKNYLVVWALTNQIVEQSHS
jgi:hypothetical protein